MRERTLKTLIIWVITASIATPSYSQQQVDIDEATKEQDRTIREETVKKLKAPPRERPEIREEKEEEAKKEGLKFFVKRIELTGVESFSPDEFRETVEKFENREQTMDALKRLTKRIERAYLKKGIIAACFIPPQEIEEGVIILQVVEAKMGEVNIRDHKYFKKERINFYWSLKPGEVLRYDKLSRSLQFMNKNPDRVVKATLHAGKRPGTTDVTLTPKTYYPIHAIGTLDLEGSASSGILRTGLGIKHNNFLALDDTVISGYIFGKHFKGIYGYHSVPITPFGTSIMYGYSYSAALPEGDFADFGIDMRSKNSSFFIYQDLFDKEEHVGNIYAGFEAKNKKVRINTGALNRDRLRIIRTGATFNYKDTDGVVNFKPEVSQSINAFGARDRDRFSSRAAERTFTKFNLTVQHRRRLPFKLQANFKMKSQLVFSKMTPQEQLSLGGINSVRGYPYGDYLADSAIQTNVELLIPAFFLPEELKVPYAARPLRDDITGLLFVDYAYGGRRGVNLWTENNKVNLMSAGAGVRVNVFDQAVVRLEWGFPLGDRKLWGRKPTSGSPAGRLHFSIDFEDKILRELERIDKILDRRKKDSEVL